MSLPEVVSREQWLIARKELLAREKELTRERDRLNADRRRLPMVEVDKKYVFEGPGGRATLLELFEGRRQLVLQHFMYDPSWEDGCPMCSADVDELSDGFLQHLRDRETTFVAVGRAPFATIDAYRATRGWTFPFYSSFGSDFNYDFHVTLDEAVAPISYNYRDRDELVAAGLGWLAEGGEAPGFSFFLRDGNRVFHTYSTFGRGVEALGGSFEVLDLTALGRQEPWEEPQGRAVPAAS